MASGLPKQALCHKDYFLLIKPLRLHLRQLAGVDGSYLCNAP